MKKIVFILLLALSAISIAIVFGYTRDAHPLLLRSPYLQQAFADSITILWRTDKGTSCQVVYYPMDNSTDKMLQATGTTKMTNTKVVENEVVLRDLQAGKHYVYQIFTDNTKLLEKDSLWFKAPIAQDESSFSFFAVGDIGEPVATGGTPHLLANALNESPITFDLGLLLGDIVYPTGQSYLYDAYFFQYFKDIFSHLPVYPVLGNHDWHEPESNYILEWKLPNNEHYYSFNYGNTHFIALDSKKGEFFQYEEQVKWLENDLTNIPQHINWIIVFLHHNGKSCTYKNDNKNVIDLYPLFEKYQVDLVLNGHAHTYERLNPMNGNGEVLEAYISQNNLYDNSDGFISITAGSGGKLRGIGSDPKPYSPDPENCKYPNLVAKTFHDWAYLEFTVADKRLSAKTFTTQTREMVDSFEIVKSSN